ncbi:uncharacterized protein [Haliotis cracherodii]|uniref:uncharacterized protein n=1 Tax=Haliotis cracherodii TaxID=6455 RepID=UPI0039EA3D44
MAIIPVMLRRKGSSHAIRTYAFLDPGSSVSFITDSMKQKLGSDGKILKITLETMGHPHSMITYSINHLEVSDPTGENFVQLPKLYTKDRMPVTHQHIPSETNISGWPHLRGVSLPQIDSEIGILIGNNVPDAYSPLHVKTGPQGSPHATFTRLGWVVWNVVRHTDVQNCFTVNRADITAIQEIEELKKLGQLVQQSINYDFPERVIDDKRQPSHNDIRFMEKVKESITLNTGHYTIPLPFKSDSVCLPDNHYQAYQRLMNLKQKMKRNDGFLSDYKDFMNNILEKNYAEKVPDDELKRDDGKVRVPCDDRDFLRFYWWPDGDLQPEPAVYRICVHLFGAVSSPSCSTAALRQTAEDNREMFNPLITDVILRSFYVDDLLKSVENEDIAKSIVTDKLCRDNVEWDKEISGDDMVIWREWLNGLSHLNNTKLPRCFKTEEFGSLVTCQLHMFSDASDHGYGVVAYLR